MSDVTMALAKYVKERGIQVSVIASKAGVSQAALYVSFSGKRKLRADEYLAVCDFLDIDPKEFNKFAQEGEN